jgi:hypothetical protein
MLAAEYTEPKDVHLVIISVAIVTWFVLSWPLAVLVGRYLNNRA